MYVRNYSSDHFALRVRLLQRPMWSHRRYLWGRHAWADGPPPALPTALALPPHKDMMAGAIRQIFEGKL